MSTRSKIAIVFGDDWFKERCFELWSRHLDWLNEFGFEQAYRRVTPQTEIDFIPSGHEVVDLLNEFIEKTGLVNAHLGLTSSDIVDNVRLMQISRSLPIIAESAALFIQRINITLGLDHAETVGFTHWQPAAPLDWRHRVNAWVSPLVSLVAVRPMICAKKFGGPVGDQASLRLILGDKLDDNPFDWSPFDLEYPNNPAPLQSSDHTQETTAINWVCAIAAQLHKIAADLRFLASHDLVRIYKPRGHAASSSMPHKNNPYKWEKVCSICRSVATTQGEMWSVQAQNGLERTLDTSWQLKSLLKRAFDGLALALDEMQSVDVVVNHNTSASMLSFMRDKISSDRDLTRRVLAGESRWAAYQQMLQQK